MPRIPCSAGALPAALALAALATVVAGCGAAAADPSPDPAAGGLAAAPRFFDLEEWVQGSAAGPGLADLYWTLRKELKAGFDLACGDTFCEGDYADLSSLSFRCSVEAKSGALGRCRWTFAGSYDTVAARSGAIATHARIFECPIPASGSAAAFLRAASAPQATPLLHRPIPGSTTTFYDALLGCLP